MQLCLLKREKFQRNEKEMVVVYFDQRLGAAHPNAGQNSSKTMEF
jgi:hypothetical protein